MDDAAFLPGKAIVDRPRLSSRPLPPYSYVPGHGPHPVTNPAGHLYGIAVVPPPPFDPDRWQESVDYLYGIDLFNHGYYWEAHETWEGLWHVAGRKGPVADFLKGLIKLAAAAVKAREGIRQGVVRHARRAEELFSGVEADRHVSRFGGLEFTSLIEAAKRLQCEEADSVSEPMPHRMLAFVIVPTL